MSFIKEKKYWIIGASTAFIGVLLVRIIIPNYFPNENAFIKSFGYFVALAGLVIITFGTRKKK